MGFRGINLQITQIFINMPLPLNYIFIFPIPNFIKALKKRDPKKPLQFKSLSLWLPSILKPSERLSLSPIYTLGQSQKGGLAQLQGPTPIQQWIDNTYLPPPCFLTSSEPEEHPLGGGISTAIFSKSPPIFPYLCPCLRLAAESRRHSNTRVGVTPVRLTSGSSSRH